MKMVADIISETLCVLRIPKKMDNIQRNKSIMNQSLLQVLRQALLKITPMG